MIAQRVSSSGMVQAMGLLIRAAPIPAVILAVVVLGSAVTSTLTVVTAGLVVGSMPGAVRDGLASSAGHHLLWALIAFATAATAGAVLSVAQPGLAATLRIRTQAELDTRLMNASLRPQGIAHLEDPEYADLLSRATADEWSPAMLAVWLPSVIAPRLQALGLAIVLARYTWWAPVVLLLAAAVAYQKYMRFADSVYQSITDSTDVIRRAGYFRDLLTGPDAAKEIRLFGLRGWLAEQLTRTWNRGMAAVWRRRNSAQLRVYGSVVVIALAMALVLTKVVLTYFHSGLSLSALTIFVQAAVALPLLGWVGDADYLARNAMSALAALGELAARAQAPGISGTAAPPVGPLQREIAFQSVTFGYPRSDANVIDGLTLRIPAGKTVAIVGANGAGKTTLIKLLARLYDPADGRILIDGTDLSEIDPEAWRNRIAIIYQDFVKYPLSLRANVGYGDLGRMADDTALAQALSEAGASSVKERLSAGWDTMLSRQYADGAELSGGEWQKVALARALLAAQRAAVLILDEPTASLDVRTETALYERLMDLTRGQTTVLISHRLSSVRKADIIYVIDGGTVAEAGSHAQLMERDGRYARMFHLQAARFGDGEPGNENRDQAQRAVAGTEATTAPAQAPAAATASADVEAPQAGKAAAAVGDHELRKSLTSTVAALGTLLRGCLGEPRSLLVRSLLLVPAASALAALQALWMRRLINGASDHGFSTAITGGLLLVGTVAAWRAVEVMGATDRITLSERVGFAFDRTVAELTAGMPGLQQHESPEFLDRLHLMRSRMLGMGSLLNWILNLLEDTGGFIITAVLLATVIPWLLLLIPVGLTALWLESLSQRIAAQAQDTSAAGYRLAMQLRDLAIDPSAGKELRVYHLSREIAARYREARHQPDTIMIKAQWPIAIAECAGTLISTLSMIGAVTIAIILGARGQVPWSAVLLVFLLASRFLGHVGGLVQGTQIVAAQMQTAERFRWLSVYASRLGRSRGSGHTPSMLRHGITFDRVSFQYPGTTRTILREVSLHLPAGSVVAIVGENGAGKTTLVKLLCCMYEPSAGDIRVEGSSLDLLDVEQWRLSLSAGFQDFVRFELLAREATGIGDLPRVRDIPAVQTALARAGAESIASSLPQGLETQLGRQWPNGVDLSAGQWQKLALGRALMRTAPLMLLLDEPTASLDAEAEHALFERFSAAARAGAAAHTITVLVSHRFSTVQMADLIIVLDQGTVAELGSHSELIARCGIYADMYRLQAAPYQEAH